jgi:translation initiation factor eIF-2B subunit delta
MRRPSPVSPVKKSGTPKTLIVRKNSNEKVSPDQSAPKLPETTTVASDSQKTREQIKAEREAKKMAKKSVKTKEGELVSSTPKKEIPPVHKCGSDLELSLKMETLHITEDKPPLPPSGPAPVSLPKPDILDTSSKLDESGKSGKPTTKAERRAIQEAQRAAKQKALDEKKGMFTPQKKAEVKVVEKTPKPAPSKSVIPYSSAALHKVKLFKHLYADKCSLDIPVNENYHPAIVKLGVQYANDVIVGSNARCYAFLNALKMVSSLYLIISLHSHT